MLASFQATALVMKSEELGGQAIHKVGVFQSRLTATHSGRIQFFPVDNWKREFDIAKEAGFAFIEWVVESNTLDLNPILTSHGRNQIAEVRHRTGVEVQGICADVFMDTPIVSKKGEDLLDQLISAAVLADTKFLELPLLGASTPEQQYTLYDLGEVLRRRSDTLAQNRTELFVEINLPPPEVSKFLEIINSDRVRINYDTGNSAYWGYSSIEECKIYGKHFGSVHIKDCTPEDYSVPLGTGSFEFDLFFSGLADIDYKGDFTLQTERNTPDFLSAAKKYKLFVDQLIAKHLGR